MIFFVKKHIVSSKTSKNRMQCLSSYTRTIRGTSVKKLRFRKLSKNKSPDYLYNIPQIILPYLMRNIHKVAFLIIKY